MNAKKKLFVTIAAIAVIGIIGFAGDQRQPESTRTEADVQRTEYMATAQPGTGEQVQPQLEPGLAKIEENYRRQMESLKNELASATTDDQREAIQQRAAELKMQWTLALADRQLELARQQGNAEAETEALHAKQAMLNPPTALRQQVPRDPNAGIVIEGGAK